MTQHLIIYTVSAILLLYGLIILVYKGLWAKLKPFRLEPSKAPGALKFSIIIPARNEEKNIGNCLHSILAGSYPKELYEITVVDDFSTDSTPAILARFQGQYPTVVKVLSLSTILDSRPINSYKKKALELAISQASGEWIVTTDADCLVPTDWLSYYDQYIRASSKRFVAAPVCFEDSGSFISKFQCLDFLSLQAVTGAAVGAGLMSMCNGANLCYQKAFFNEVGGFKGVDELASGDDMFLMQKMQHKDPSSTGYLFASGAIVSTLPMPDWSSFLNQRIRWASKAGAYKDWKIKLVLLLVYLMNLGMLLVLLMGLWVPKYLVVWLGLLLFKFMVEYMFMRAAAKFFQQQKLLSWFLLMQPFHMVYTVVAGMLGLFGKYTWKGRSVR